MYVKLKSRIPEANSKIKDTAYARMVKTVHAVRNETLLTLSGERTGRVYRVPGTQRFYIASAPGEPPAKATGRLRESVVGTVDYEGLNIVGYVGIREGEQVPDSKVTVGDYAKWLEYGTKRMEPRPWLRPSFEKSEDKIKGILGGTWQI